MLAFLDTNNIVYWRTNIQRIDIGSDTAVGILNADLPPSVGYLSVLPTNYYDYIPTNGSLIQGVGMNQDMRVFGQPMTFVSTGTVYWGIGMAPFGLTTNWTVAIRPGGDSSAPERIIIGNQLVLVSDNGSAANGPDYAFQFDVINQKMHFVSTNNNVGSDYQLTPFSLTNWPVIH